LSEPVRQKQLLAMLIKRLCARPAAAGSGAPPAGGAPWTLPAGAEGVLDAGVLERLRQLDPSGQNQLLQRIVQAFETSATRLLGQLQDARRADDPAGIRHVAHTLKSSSASIGAVQLSQLCADIEAKIRTDRLENIEERIDAMRVHVEIVLQALKRLLDAPS